MNNPQKDNHDPLEAMLGPGLQTPSDDLREALVDRTSTVLRRRLLTRRVSFLLALIACYIGGAWTMGYWNPDQTVTTPVEEQQDVRVVIEEQDPDSDTIPDTPEKPAVVERETPVPRPAPRPGPRTVIGSKTKLPELPSAHPGETRFEKYCRLGDELADAGKIPSAIRAYKAALSFATEEEKKIRADKESWLLTSLKRCH